MSLSVPDTRSGSDADHIMDQLLGDIRSGFPERRLGEIYRRSKSKTDQDDIATFRLKPFEDAKQKSQAAIKRHSDPTMFLKSDITNKSDEKLSVKSRRARFLDESNGDEIIGFLQNPGENEIREGRSFESSDDFNLERFSSRRSGRRKRGDILNGEIQTRERMGSSPPPVVLPAAEEDSELTEKQILKTKINDWMLQNEKEQKRDRELQLRMLKRQKTNDSIIDENVEDALPRTQNGFLENTDEKSGISTITRSSLSRQSDNFTQKIINLLNSSSNSQKTFERSKLYHSTREISSKKHEVENKAKDDNEIKNSEKENTLLEKQEIMFVSDQESNKESFKNLHHLGNFDRFASTRKTQRRLKLKEMRIEAENAIKLPVLNNSKEVSTTGSFQNLEVQVEEESKQNLNSSNIFKNGQACEKSDSAPEDTMKFDTHRDSIVSSVSSTPTERLDSSPFNRNKNTSLRSRQSRLARRIDSLTTPVTSPVDEGKPIPGDKKIDEVPEMNHKTETEPIKNKASQSNQENVSSKDDKKTRKKDSEGNNTKDNPINNATQHERTMKMNGHISHEVRISTESRKISAKSAPTQNTKSTASASSANRKTTVTPNIVKTTQNVKIQQTIQKANNKTITANGRLNKTSKLSSIPSPINSPSLSKKATLNNRESKSKTTLNGNLENGKKDGISQSSSVSSICNMSTNIKLIKDQKAQGRNSNRIVNGDKITINHNGSIRFARNGKEFNKTMPKIATNTSVTSRGPVERKDKTATTRKKL